MFQLIRDLGVTLHNQDVPPNRDAVIFYITHLHYVTYASRNIRMHRASCEDAVFYSRWANFVDAALVSFYTMRLLRFAYACNVLLLMCVHN